MFKTECLPKLIKFVLISAVCLLIFYLLTLRLWITPLTNTIYKEVNSVNNDKSYRETENETLARYNRHLAPSIDTIQYNWYKVGVSFRLWKPNTKKVHTLFVMFAL